jgi:CheY-like chemotaxis protein
MSLRPILYAEDDENDAYFLQRAFRLAGVAHPLVIVSNGQEVIDYFSGEGRYAQRDEHPLPCLVLLDLNMPKKSGIEALKWIREKPSFRSLPVLVLTSSLQDNDIERAYLAGANAYLAKPSQPEGLNVMAQSINNFWFAQNRTAQKVDKPMGP